VVSREFLRISYNQSSKEPVILFGISYLTYVQKHCSVWNLKNHGQFNQFIEIATWTIFYRNPRGFNMDSIKYLGHLFFLCSNLMQTNNIHCGIHRKNITNTERNRTQRGSTAMILNGYWKWGSPYKKKQLKESGRSHDIQKM
jgi:hypothetical protein